MKTGFKIIDDVLCPTRVASSGKEAEDVFLHVYKLKESDGSFRVKTLEGKYMSPKEAMEEMGISLRGLSSYKYSGAKSTSDEYKKFKELTESGDSEKEAYIKVFETE